MIFLSPCRFQSTFPRGERHLCWLVAVKHIHFNPRSLVGNDYIPVGTYTIVEISIHVPSWGTTIFTRRQPPCILFQSTFPRGERRQLRKILHKTKQISIHVPSWGTTQCLANTRRMRLFQSTFPRGERPETSPGHPAPGHFNPRSLVGNDLHDLVSLAGQHYFNPRSLVGNDGKFSQIFFVFLCNKYNFSTFYYPFSLFFSVIHVTFLIFVVRILPAFYVYF